MELKATYRIIRLVKNLEFNNDILNLSKFLLQFVQIVIQNSSLIKEVALITRVSNANINFAALANVNFPTNKW